MAVNINTLATQIRELVETHKTLKRNGKLLLAGWYDKENSSGDVSLFEVYEDFPDPGIGRLDTYLFPSSADLPMTGSLRLTVTSPTELRDAAARDDATWVQVKDSKDMEVIYPENAIFDEVIERLMR